MSKPVVFLSAGHGGSDPGAMGYGLREKEINLQVMLTCKSWLERHGVVVIPSRTRDEDDAVREEVREANASGADLAVSIHTNAGGGDGFEAFFFSTDEKGKKAAQLCEKQVKALGQNSRGVKKGDHLYWCKNVKIPSCLVENFFIDNNTDKDIGDTLAEQNAFGIAYAKAILEYFSITYKSQAPSEPWYADDQKWAVLEGISDGSRPEEPVTRAEVWAMLHRFSKK